MKYSTTVFLLLLLVMALSVPTGFAFASEDDRDDDDREYDDDRYDDDDRDDDRYDDDDRDDDRYDDDDRDDDRYDDDDRDDDRYDDDDRDDDRYDDDDRDDDRYDDDDRDDNSKTSERKVKAETLGFQSNIEIEIEFVSNTADTNQLIDEIIERFSLTREEAENELRMERSDDHRFEEKFNVEIEKRGNTSKVEVELEFAIDSTSKSDIVDAIVKNSQLTKEQIQEKLQIGSDSKITSSSNVMPNRSSDSSETEQLLRQENQQLKDEIKQMNQRLDDMQQVIMEQMKVIMDTLKNLESK